MNSRNGNREARNLRAHAVPLGGGGLLRVSPVPTGRNDILALAMHFARRFAATAGKEAPNFSEDAARFLASQRWSLADLTIRVCRAVEQNRGNLITAADLGAQ